MKTTTKTLTPWMAALLCLTLTPAIKAGDEPEAPKPPASHDPEAKSAEGAPAKFNKASGILGMDVRNQEDQHLGHIKDVVFDLKTERVSYAVISTAPKALLGIDEKLLAVPLSALTPSADHHHLILNADKSKVETAMGFDHNQWPSVVNPSWGAEPFWQKESEPPAMTDQPAKEPEAAATEEMKPESKPDSEPETPPDMEPDTSPDMDEEPAPDTDPEPPGSFAN